MAERPLSESMPAAPAGRILPPWLRFLDRYAPPVLLAAFLLVAARELLPSRPRRPKPAAAAALPPQDPGHARVALPKSVPLALTRVSLYQNGDYARSADGVTLRDLRPTSLAAHSVPPGVYVAIFRYRNQPVGGDVIQIAPGQSADLKPPLSKFAEVEYQAGLQAGTRRNEDVARFRRTVKLNPKHVDARLQLAAYALSRGDRKSARAQLAVVKRLEPGNPHLKRVARLLGGKV